MSAPVHSVAVATTESIEDFVARIGRILGISLAQQGGEAFEGFDDHVMVDVIPTTDLESDHDLDWTPYAFAVSFEGIADGRYEANEKHRDQRARWLFEKLRDAGFSVMLVDDFGVKLEESPRRDRE